MKISVFEVDGYEADDVIGTIAKKMQSKKTEVVAVTGDRDLLQLVNSHVKLYMPVKGLSEAKLYGEKEAEERMGVTPRQIPDLKALAGDASDNFPGVAGIGPKTAATLLKEFGTVEKLYNNLEKVKNESVRNKLEKGKEDATLAKTLATVVTDVPIEVDLEKLQLPDFVRPEVVEYFNELGFKTLVKRLTGVEKQNSKRIAQKPQETEKANDNQLGLF